MSSNARSFLKRVNALASDGVIARKAVVRWLLEVTPTEATELLTQVLELAKEGLTDAKAALPFIVKALSEETETEAAEVLRRVAALQDYAVVEGLLGEGTPVMEYDARAAALADAKMFNMPLGYLKTQARLTTNPDELVRLAAASNAAVVRELLKNPRLTEALVIRIAARRPVRSEPLVEIWRSERWSMRTSVRRALVFNPYLPPEIGVKLVALLATPDVKLVAQDNSLHTLVREQAVRVLATTNESD